MKAGDKLKNFIDNKKNALIETIDSRMMSFKNAYEQASSNDDKIEILKISLAWTVDLIKTLIKDYL